MFYRRVIKQDVILYLLFNLVSFNIRVNRFIFKHQVMNINLTVIFFTIFKISCNILRAFLICYIVHFCG